jgi:broad specificity phosphatase PhoE
MHVYFVRHGESTTNVDSIVTGQKLDPSLTDKGRSQAEDAARWLKANEIPIHAIISSPSKRTMETARIIAGVIGYPISSITQWHDLSERDFGEFEGGPDSAYFHTPEAIATSEYGAESIPAFYGRVQNAINQLRDNYPDKNVLLVSHNGVGKMLDISFQGKDSAAYDRAQRLPNGEVIELTKN